MHDTPTGDKLEVDEKREEAVVPGLGVLLHGGHGASHTIPHMQRPRLARGEILAAQHVDGQVVVAVVGLGVGGLLQDLIVTVALVAVAFQTGQQILQTMDTRAARCWPGRRRGTGLGML